jgi:hypothetical protein
LDPWSGWSFVAFEPNSSLKKKTSKFGIFYKFGKHQQSRYIERCPIIKLDEIIAGMIYILQKGF